MAGTEVVEKQVAKSKSFLVNIADRPNNNVLNKDGKRVEVPGVPNAPYFDTAKGVTKFLGREGKDGEGPWVYYLEKVKGDDIPFHSHRANRTEFVIEGRIEWREPGKEPKVYGAGTLSYVEAETVYGIGILEDTKIFVVFDKAPGITTI